METVTTLPQSRPLTASDLDAMPDDGHRYELVDGTLVVTPAPSTRHQIVSLRLAVLLDGLSPTGIQVLTAPVDVRLSDHTSLQPDVLVCRRADLTDRHLPVAPLLAIEILSPSTRHVDLSLKRARYEAAGCPSYWVVDPDTLEITCWELRAGSYAEIGRASGDDEIAVTEPFPVSFAPVDLVR